MLTFLWILLPFHIYSFRLRKISQLNYFLQFKQCSEEIDIQLKSRLERERSNDTTTGSSNVTVIENDVEENIIDEICDNFVAPNNNNYGDNLKFDEIGNVTKAVVEAKESSSSSNTNSSISSASKKPSCLLRRDSSRASIKKKVRCSETAEIIPATGLFINCDELQPTEDDEDDVFCDSAPAQISRGNMCTPYVPRKGSLPVPEALPDWFPSPRFISPTHSPFS